ncbi:unnamed protein product [Paramecium sonneborni]|uniref:Uncharacterized protein n=1 Tax=Paramecium sonneborni TaxID=65129 RepID=A0A8S1R8A9_9CILI|nr:unnamed protein product [Paramecium sonneborni]
MANELNIPYFEISCLTGQNVELVIENITTRVWNQMQKGNLSLKQKKQTQNAQKDEKIKTESECCKMF